MIFHIVCDVETSERDFFCLYKKFIIETKSYYSVRFVNNIKFSDATTIYCFQRHKESMFLAGQSECLRSFSCNKKQQQR